MVTNGLFARKYDKALQFFRDVNDHLGADKARKLGIKPYDFRKKGGA